MKTKAIATIAAVLTAAGGYFAAKYALPADAVNEVVSGLVAVISGAFGIYAAKHKPTAQ